MTTTVTDVYIEHRDEYPYDIEIFLILCLIVLSIGVNGSFQGRVVLNETQQQKIRIKNEKKL